jgi:CRP-like cAMP-binding protein
VLLQAALESEKVLVDPAPVVRVKEAGSSYKYMVFAYFESYPSHLAGLDDLFMHVWVQCARHGIVPSAVTSEIIVRKGVAEEIKGPSPNDLLAQVELFSKVDESSRQVLVSNLKVRTVPMGKEVVCHGEEGTSLYIVSAGMVRVIINNTPEGDMREVAKLGVGEYFGEESLLSEEPSTITVAAHTDCQLLEVDKESMKSVFDSHPELMHVMAQIMTERRLSNEESTKNLSEEDFTSKLNDLAGNLVGRMKKIF